MPGADDQAIFADIVGPLGHDRNAVRQVLAMLRETAGGDFAGLLPTPLTLAIFIIADSIKKRLSTLFD